MVATTTSPAATGHGGGQPAGEDHVAGAQALAVGRRASGPARRRRRPGGRARRLPTRSPTTSPLCSSTTPTSRRSMPVGRHRRADDEAAGRGVVGDDVGHREPVVGVARVEHLDARPRRRRWRASTSVAVTCGAGEVAAHHEDDLGLAARAGCARATCERLADVEGVVGGEEAVDRARPRPTCCCLARLVTPSFQPTSGAAAGRAGAAGRRTPVSRSRSGHVVGAAGGSP